MFCFLCDGNHSPSFNECLRKKIKREVIETPYVELISIGSAKRQVMGANKSENSSYAAAIKKRKFVERKEVVDRVHPVKNDTQSRSKAEVELSAAEVELSAVKLVFSPQPKSRQLGKSICLLQNLKLLKLHNPPPWQPVDLLQQKPLMPLPQVHPKQSLRESRDSSSEGLQSVVPVVGEVHRSEGLGSKAMRNKRFHTPSSPPPPPHSISNSF